jgi:hypothetical protein
MPENELIPAANNAPNNAKNINRGIVEETR